MAAVLAWFILLVCTAVAAVTLYPSKGLLLTMSPVMLGAVAVVALLAGFVVVISPDTFRSIQRAFLKPLAVRIAGVATMVVGAALFRAGYPPHLSVAAEIVGVLAFVEGGVQLLIPNVAIIITEWCLDWPATWLRVLGVASLALAGLFLYASGYMTPGAESPVVAISAKHAVGRHVRKPKVHDRIPPLSPLDLGKAPAKPSH